MTRTIQQAAPEIVALINSKPSSPSEAEIAEILGRIGTPAVPMSPAHAAHYREWRRLIEEHVREFSGPEPETETAAERKAEEERLAAHLKTIDTLAYRILATPARTWGDVVLYAEVAHWEQWLGADPERQEAQRWRDSGLVSVGGLCDQSLIKLIEAILSIAVIGRPRP